MQVNTEPTGGGAELVVRELHKGLLDRGIDSEVVFLSNNRNIQLGPGEQVLPFSGKRSLRSVAELRRALASTNATAAKIIVHSHLTWPFYTTPIAAAGMGVPLCYTEHSTTNRRRDIALLRPLEKLIYKRYARVFSISDAVNDSLLAWIGNEAAANRTVVVPNGSRLLEYKGNRTITAGTRLVSVGSLRRYKGFEWSLRAVAALRDVVDSYIIVGEGPDRSFFESLIHELRIDDIVSLVGWVDDICPYYHEADILVVPSLWEGFGLVCIEGMSTGLPVVASDVAGMSALLRDSGAATLVPPSDTEALAAAVRQLSSALRSGAEYSERARKTALLYGMDKMVGNYIAAYEELGAEWYGRGV